mmetsp:Transcript_22487/g.68543  ORF Transcript_22487/g.68543 Transcript_22487/m.68543 type:complete len:168 (+) Transcript_22487:291-794(+)
MIRVHTLGKAEDASAHSSQRTPLRYATSCFRSYDRTPAGRSAPATAMSCRVATSFRGSPCTRTTFTQGRPLRGFLRHAARAPCRSAAFTWQSRSITTRPSTSPSAAPSLAPARSDAADVRIYVEALLKVVERPHLVIVVGPVEAADEREQVFNLVLGETIGICLRAH